MDEQKHSEGDGSTGSGDVGKKRRSSKPIEFYFSKQVKARSLDAPNPHSSTTLSEAEAGKTSIGSTSSKPLAEPTAESANLVEENSNNPSDKSSPQYDIGAYVDKINELDDYTKFCLLEKPWSPSAHYAFPYSVHTKAGKEVKRYVNRHYLTNYHWLALSDVHRGLYCKYCVLFAGDYGMHQRNSSLGLLVKKPLKSFAKLFGKDGCISNHDKTQYHKDALITGKNFVQSYNAPELEVVNQMNKQRLAQVQENRARLRPIVETIVFCGRQNIPLRGHRDDGSLVSHTSDSDSIVKNEGNFRELLRFRIDAGDTTLEKHLMNASANATYVSKTTQNELINYCGEEAQQAIFERVRKTKWFSIIFDETTDEAHKEQMSISLRYVHENTCREDFVAFIDCYDSIRPEDIIGEEKRLSGKALAHIVIDFCKKHSLDLENCVGIGTDNCSVMASEVKGAVQEICKIAKNAKRCPCLNHSLNNSLKRSNNVLGCRNTVGKMKEIIAFSNSSAKITAVFRELLGRSFSGLCETRWQEKHDGTIQFCTLMPEICKGLEKITKWSNSPDTVTKAYGLLKSVTESEFIITTFALSDVLGTTLALSRFLQSPALDAVSAIDAVKDVFSVLQEKRNNVDDAFRKIYEKAEIIADKLEIDISRPRTARRSLYRANHSMVGRRRGSRSRNLL